MRHLVTMCMLTLFSLPGLSLAGSEEEAARQVGLCAASLQQHGNDAFSVRDELTIAWVEPAS